MADISPEPKFDSLLPPEMAIKAENIGVKKATMPPGRLFALAVLAGAFIALGAIFATTVATGSALLPFGVAKLLVGLVFCLGLILVVVGGAELFTGNNLTVMAWANKKISTRQLLVNWGIVYVGNFVGSIVTALFMFFTEQYTFAQGQIGVTAMGIANAKCSLGFIQAIALGMMCNALVCLAVWLTFSARTTACKILAVIFPITAFVASGFEHSIANMYFIPIGLFIKAWAGADYFSLVGAAPAAYDDLTWGNFFLRNLLPVTIGNLIGGGLLVGLVYWFIFLRGRR